MKKLFSFIKESAEPLAVVGVVLVAGLAYGASASAINLDDGNINPLYLEYLEDVRNGEGNKWNIVPDMYMPRAVDEGYGGESDLPSAYNLVDEGYATQIKNQGSDGICWAYAITTAMESNLLKKQNISEVFSAKQLDYLMAPGAGYHAHLEGLFDDYNYELGGGSNFGYASFSLSDASVPADESSFFVKMRANDPGLQQYNSYGQFEDWNAIKIYFNNEVEPYTVEMGNELITGTRSDYFVDEYTQYYASVVDINTIKEAVYNNGAVYVQTFAPQTAGCWDATTDTIVARSTNICDKERGHAMAIVGWDDNYAYIDPADNIQKNGAFILQNSWGNDDLLLDYGITYDYLVATGAIDPSELTEEQINAIKESIANYNALDFVYLAYNFERTNGVITSFASLGVEENNYKYIDGVLDEVDGLGASVEEGANEIVYTYDAGETKRRIGAISVGMHLITAEESISPVIYVDNGDGWQEFGSVTLPANVSFKRTVLANKKIDVSGVYKVKVDFGDVNNLNDYYQLLTTTVYANDAPEDEGDDTPGGDEEGGDAEEEEEEDIKVPNTGLFVGGFKGILLMMPVAMLVMGAGYVICRAYKNRKEIFHKVKFDKK